MKCKNCNSKLIHKFVDLGFSPPSNSLLKLKDLNKSEIYYPLKAMFAQAVGWFKFMNNLLLKNCFMTIIHIFLVHLQAGYYMQRNILKK